MKIIDDIIEAHVFRIVQGEVHFLVLKRAANEEVYPGVWQPITGRMHEGEKAWEAAIREIKEETGLSPESFWVVPNVNSFYNPVKDTASLIPVFAAKVAENSEVVLSEEHDDFMWASLDEVLPLLAWPGQRRSADIVQRYFKDEKFYFDLVKLI